MVTISQPGSYYLAHNLTVSTGDGIDINTNGVTLDLNGFTIASTAPSAAGYGILLNSSLSDITIVNGHICSGATNGGGFYSGSGFGYGIYGASANVVVSKVSVAGVLWNGIYLNTGNATVVETCTVTTAGYIGIAASTVTDSVATDCGNTAISAIQVAYCKGSSYASGGQGITAYIALNCCGQSTSGYGLSAYTALNCYGYSSSGWGLSAQTAENCYGHTTSGVYGLATYGTALNCHGDNSSGTGLYAYTAQNCDGSSSTSYGISAYTAQNCRGYSSSGTGLYAKVANTCVGERAGGTAIQATIGIGCYAQSGTNNITYKYNMP